MDPFCTNLQGKKRALQVIQLYKLYMQYLLFLVLLIMLACLILLVKFTSFGSLIGLRRRVSPQMYAEQTNIGQLIRSGKISNRIEPDNLAHEP